MDKISYACRSLVAFPASTSCGGNVILSGLNPGSCTKGNVEGEPETRGSSC